MKTKLVNFRVDELAHAKIKRAALAAHESVTDFLLSGAAMRMKAMAGQAKAVDPLDEAFNELFQSGQISPLTASERALVKSYSARKAAGKLKIVDSGHVLANIDKELGQNRRRNKAK
jgi:uncharacterized protein (DUF1778 family)